MKELIEKLSMLEVIFYLKRDQVDGGPHPMYFVGNMSEATKELLQSSILRDLSALIEDDSIGRQVYNAGRKMLMSAATAYVADYDEEICPPYFFFPWPIPHPNWNLPADVLNQQLFTNQYFLFDQMAEIRPFAIAEMLRVNASLTTSHTLSNQLKDVAKTLAKPALSEKAFMEFEERCGNTHPRLPLPGKRFQQTEEMEMVG